MSDSNAGHELMRRLSTRNPTLLGTSPNMGCLWVGSDPQTRAKIRNPIRRECGSDTIQSEELEDQIADLHKIYAEAKETLASRTQSLSHTLIRDTHSNCLTPSASDSLIAPNPFTPPQSPFPSPSLHRRHHPSRSIADSPSTVLFASSPSTDLPIRSSPTRPPPPINIVSTTPHLHQISNPTACSILLRQYAVAHSFYSFESPPPCCPVSTHRRAPICSSLRRCPSSPLLRRSVLLGHRRQLVAFALRITSLLPSGDRR
ncbi:hypothetical protein PIB30_019772 [Stylosanthes scabra]|uniref:Uncharacterized protein n=1 Tax=Stylosanthes scabra TaxID=79078 RepID=A0ABU6Y7A7_9FABA|nr:hypothetical protein [Stylosanthes scabra]